MNNITSFINSIFTQGKRVLHNKCGKYAKHGIEHHWHKELVVDPGLNSKSQINEMNG